MSKDPYRYFRIEARELLDVLQKGIVELSSGVEPDKLRTLMRATHTLKGAAGVVRQPEIAKLAHRIEDLLEAKAPADDILPLVDEVAAALASLGAPAPAVAAPSGSKSAEPAPVVTESVRLDLAEVDALLASLADLSARVSTLRSKSGTELEAMLDGVERLAHGTLEDARRLRLLPAETLFAEVARGAHEASSRAGRLIDIETRGGDRRIDAHVLGVVRDALLQLVRNAIAHGIEPPADRVRTGKPKAGRIAVSVEVRGPRALVRCRDDGRGIDIIALRAAIVERRLASREEAATLDVTALMKIAIRAGVSTRTVASELAGRGVGLQIVGHAVDRLHGTIAVRTTPGVGTEIELDVPVSITAAPALVVAAGKQDVTIALDAIVKTTRISGSEVLRTADGDCITDEGTPYRFGVLARILGEEATGPRDGWTAILLQGADGRAAVGIERVLGIQNVVILPLPPSAIASPIVVGASLDGEGNPRLALDPRRLVGAIADLQPLAIADENVTPSPTRVLVCDDSLTSRMLEQSILEAAGYDITTATSGEEALEKARGESFALFVVDVEMPGMTGFETVSRMRADPALASTPAVLVTSRATPEDKRRGLESGARAYIVKAEFAQTEFLDTVRRLIG